jgi:hypothetical protein
VAPRSHSNEIHNYPWILRLGLIDYLQPAMRIISTGDPELSPCILFCESKMVNRLIEYHDLPDRTNKE